MSTVAPAREAVVVAAEPRVQLLPKSVKLREKARNARHLMILLVVLALAVSAAGMTLAFLRASQAQVALDAATARTDQLIAEQAQYAEATQMAQLVADTEAAQITVTSTEIDWLPLMIEVGSYLPNGASITGLALQAPAPWETPLTPNGPLRAEHVATVALDITAPSYAHAARFVEAIRGMYGLADVAVTGTTEDSGDYITSVQLTLNVDAIKARFGPNAATTDAGVDEADAEAPAEADAATEDAATTEETDQ